MILEKKSVKMKMNSSVTTSMQLISLTGSVIIHTLVAGFW